MSDLVDRLLDWEGRPAAILKSGLAFAVLDATSGWVKVSATEVSESGNPISAATFATKFPNTDLSKIPNTLSPEDKVAISNTTIMDPSSVVLSSPKNKAHSRHEYSHTYKASEDRWLAEGLERTLKRMEKEGKLPGQKKAKKDR